MHSKKTKRKTEKERLKNEMQLTADMTEDKTLMMVIYRLMLLKIKQLTGIAFYEAAVFSVLK